MDAAEERRELRKRARLLGHQLEVRADHRNRDFYNNGAGIVPNTLDSEGYEPNGWNVIETQRRVLEQLQLLPRRLGLPHRLRAGSANSAARRSTTRPGSGSSSTAATTTSSAATTCSATTSGASPRSRAPAKSFVANEGNEAKNVNNQIVENTMGREGADPNGEYDFWNDDTGGGNCWGGNSANVDLRARQRQSAAEPDLPGLPAGRKSTYDQRRAASTSAPGLQIASLATKPATRRRSSATPARTRRRTSSAPGSGGSPRTRRSRSSSRSRSRRSRAK